MAVNTNSWSKVQKVTATLETEQVSTGAQVRPFHHADHNGSALS